MSKFSQHANLIFLKNSKKKFNFEYRLFSGYKNNSANINSKNKKTSVYFYNLRKKKLFERNFSDRSKLKSFNIKQKILFKKKKSSVYFDKNTIRIFKRPLRDFFLNSQFAERLTIKNYNRPLFFNFAKTRKFFFNNASNSAYEYKKKIDDKYNLDRSILIKKYKNDKLFFLVFKKIMMSRSFFALLRVFDFNTFSPYFSNFNFYKNSESSGFFKFNKKVILKKQTAVFLKPFLPRARQLDLKLQNLKKVKYLSDF